MSAEPSNLINFKKRWRCTLNKYVEKALTVVQLICFLMLWYSFLCSKLKKPTMILLRKRTSDVLMNKPNIKVDNYNS
jgi:hypothetical protein